MTAFICDTLTLVEIRKEADVLEEQAKAITTVIQKSHEAAVALIKAEWREYASVLKSDFEKFEHSMEVKHELLRHEMSDFRKDTQHAIKELESRLTIKLGSIVVAALGAFVLLSKFLALS